VLNAGFMTNYFQVSRGARQGCPLSPLLFVLSVELLTLKIRQDQLCRGVPLPDGQNAKISQFADDTTLILEDTISLRKAMNIVNSFGALSGLQLNKKKTKAMWIGSSSKIKSMPLEYLQSAQKNLLNFWVPFSPTTQLAIIKVFFFLLK